MPTIATGSWVPPRDEKAHSDAKNWLLTALQAGYRHIDTAEIYGTEDVVGEAVRASGIPRQQIFVTTKLAWNEQGRVAEAFEETIQRLGLGYIDLYLIHWPQAVVYEKGNYVPKNPDGTLKMNDAVNFNIAWAEMEKLLGTGKVRAIGVSNFSVKTLDQLFTTAKVTPAVNQVELHPYLAQEDLRKYCTQKGIVLQAYTPSGWANVRNDLVILELAKKYKATSTQIILSWHLAREVPIVAKSADKERQKENFAVITLDAEDVAEVSSLDRGQRICNVPTEQNNWIVHGWTAEQLGW